MNRVHSSELGPFSGRYLSSFPSFFQFFFFRPDRPQTLRRRRPDHPISHSHAYKSKDSFSDDSRGFRVQMEVRDVAFNN